MPARVYPASAARAPIISVALLDDDPHFLLYLESLLAASPRHCVAATAGSAAAALRWPASLHADIILMDVWLPDRAGSAIVAVLREKFSAALVIMLTAANDDVPLLEAIRAGAAGYVLKGASETEILAAIDDALAGGAPMSPAIARRLLALMRATPAAVKDHSPALAPLTVREREVLELVAAGAADKEIAGKLGVARSTVKNALFAIYGKWRVRSRTEAAVKFDRAQRGDTRR